MAPTPQVSVIVAARDAADTLARTLTSLTRQTLPGWEAVVIDDGSADDTADLAAQWARSDPRVRVVRQSAMGVSAARNRGIDLAAAPWLLFLDADDELEPAALLDLTGIVQRRPEADVVHCAWTRMLPDGRGAGVGRWTQAADPFDTFARYCAVQIGACMVRRAVVVDVGGFDTSLVTCEDWDLWQRLARMGACWVPYEAVLACIHLRPRSASRDAGRLLSDGIRVIATGHGPDPRLKRADPRYAAGRTAEPPLAAAGLLFGCYVAGMLLGGGMLADGVVDALPPGEWPDLDPGRVVSALLTGMGHSLLLPAQDLVLAWPTVAERADRFFGELERRSGAPGLAARLHPQLRRQLTAHRPPSRMQMMLTRTGRVVREPRRVVRRLRSSRR